MADKVRITPYIDREVFEQIERIHRERRKTNKMMRLSTVVNEALKFYLHYYEEDSEDSETLEEFLLKSSGVSEELCGPSNNNSDSNRIDNDEIQQFTTPEWEQAVKNIYEEVRHDSRHRDKYIEVVEFIKNYNPEKE